jgi:hypothetical protein
MIINKEITINYLGKWLADYAKDANKSLLVLSHDNTNQYNLLHKVCSCATVFYPGLNIHIHFGIGDQLYEIAEDKGLIISCIDKSFGLYYRWYSKLEMSISDLFPLFDLNYSEILELLEKPIVDNSLPEKYELLEWCNLMEERYKIITSNEVPNKDSRWPFFIQEQKDILAKVYQREKKTRHKIITKPYPNLKCLRNMP